MRIIIESGERESGVPSVQVSTEPTPMEAMNGGAPSEMLIQAMGEALPIPSEVAAAREGADAGSPPEWLVKAIQDATSPDNEVANAASDGGTAAHSGG